MTNKGGSGWQRVVVKVQSSFSLFGWLFCIVGARITYCKRIIAAVSTVSNLIISEVKRKEQCYSVSQVVYWAGRILTNYPPTLL